MAINNENKRIVINTLYLYIPMVVSMCIGLYTSRAILDVLGVEDYGIYNVVGGFVAMLAIFTNSITSAAQRFITFSLGTGNLDNLKKTMSNFILLYIFLAIVIFVLGEILGIYLNTILNIPEDRLNAAYYVYHCSLLTFCLNLVFVPYNACIIAHEHMRFFSFMKTLDTILKLVIVLSLYYVTLDGLKVYSVLLFCISIINGIVYLGYCFRNFIEAKCKLIFDCAIFKSIFKYSVWVTIGASSGVLKDQGINVVINRFLGVSMNAARGVSLQVNAVVSQFSSNIGTAITPQITKSFASGNFNRAVSLTYLLAKVQACVLILLSTPIVLEADYLLTLWLKTPPYYSVTFTQVILIQTISQALNSSLDPILLASGKVKWAQIIGGGMLLLNVPVAYTLLQKGFAPASTVIATIIIELLVMTTVLFILRKTIKFPIYKFLFKVIGPILLTVGMSYIIPYYIRELMETGFLQLLIVGMSSVIVSLFLIFIIILNSREKAIIIDYIIKKIKH